MLDLFRLNSGRAKAIESESLGTFRQMTYLLGTSNRNSKPMLLTLTTLTRLTLSSSEIMAKAHSE